MFKPYTSDAGTAGQTITIQFDGRPLTVPRGITVAAAVLGHGRETYLRRSPVDAGKRGPFCFMGVCHECLMEINGKPNQQACIIEVEDGMIVNRQNGPAEVTK